MRHGLLLTGKKDTAAEKIRQIIRLTWKRQRRFRWIPEETVELEGAGQTHDCLDGRFKRMALRIVMRMRMRMAMRKQHKICVREAGQTLRSDSQDTC